VYLSTEGGGTAFTYAHHCSRGAMPWRKFATCSVAPLWDGIPQLGGITCIRALADFDETWDGIDVNTAFGVLPWCVIGSRSSQAQTD